jgi:CCR4-NOT transcription complex subunit 3
MERFKACEKEMKTKAFSKEGLLASSKMDPKEKERHEMGHFLMDMVEELGKQVEQAEAEQESLQIALKKGRKDPGKVERLTEVEHLVERHKWHQGRLELILRLLENGNIQTEQVILLQPNLFAVILTRKVASIKEDIDYYVNENQAVDFTEDEDIYNDLNLLEEEDMYGVGDDHQSSLDAQSVTEEYPPTPQKEEPIVKPRDPVVVPSNRRASVATNRPVVTSTTATAPPVPQPNGVPKPPPQAARPPIELKYASAVAAATNPASLLGLGPLPPPSSAPIRQASVSSIGSSTGRATSPITLISSGSSQLPTISSSVPIFPLNKDKPITAPNGSPKSATSPAVATPVPEPTTVPDAVSTPVSAPPELPAINALSLNGDVLSDSPTTFGLNGTDEADIAMLPPGLRDLLHSFQSARSRAEASSVSSAPVSTTGKMLEASRLGAPDAFDSESKKRYSPQTPYATPSYYPQLPHPVVVDPSFVRRCDVDTLFFMFYYQQETVQQYLPKGKRFINFQVSCCERTEKSKLAISQKVHYLVPTSRRAERDPRDLRDGLLSVL